jgi:hypothetical protein
MEIEGLGSGKDFKLYPGGGRPWDWSETGTRHVPGIQPTDVAELIAHGCSSVVLSQGMDLALEICPETLTILEQNGIRTYVAETREAVKHYNTLVEQGIAVGGLFHSTC